MLAGRMIGLSRGDPDFANVVVLLHMDGSDASTTFTDVKGHTFTANGNAQIDTAQSKSGGASGLFDGAGDYLSATATADFGFGAASDFTIEAFLRLAATGMGTDRGITDFRTGSNTGVTFFVNPSNKLTVWIGSTVGGTGTALVADTWYHVVLSRSGTTTRCFLDGALEWSSTASLNFGATAPLGVGGAVYAGAAGSSPFNGHLDELRITKGVARYTANFTAPTQAFPDF